MLTIPSDPSPYPPDAGRSIIASPHLEELHSQQLERVQAFTPLNIPSQLPAVTTKLPSSPQSAEVQRTSLAEKILDELQIARCWSRKGSQILLSEYIYDRTWAGAPLGLNALLSVTAVTISCVDADNYFLSETAVDNHKRALKLLRPTGQLMNSIGLGASKNILYLTLYIFENIAPTTTILETISNTKHIYTGTYSNWVIDAQSGQTIDMGSNVREEHIAKLQEIIGNVKRITTIS